MRGLPHSEAGAPPLLRDGFPFLGDEASPAAGASFTATVDGRYYERLLTVWCRLVTSADVANREVVLEFLNAAGDTYRACGAATTVPADQTVDYSFSVWQSEDTFAVNGGVLVPLDPILIAPTFKWKLTVVNVDNTDQLSRIRVYRERFFSDSPIPARDYAKDQ